MSEYQYYEWQTIDRPLNPSERQAVSRLSSHMDTVTSTQAIVTYSWGDFKHDPRQVLLQYFDAHLYMANWGTRRLMFRFPKSVIDPQAIQPYCREDSLNLELDGNYYVLEFSQDDESGDDEWLEGEGLLYPTPCRKTLVARNRTLIFGFITPTPMFDVCDVILETNKHMHIFVIIAFVSTKALFTVRALGNNVSDQIIR